MPRPVNKSQLLSESRDEYRLLEEFLANLDPQKMTQPGALGEWSVKDVLAHLYEWQQMFFRWHETALQGETPFIPAKGFKWNQLPALNRQIYEQYRDYPLDKVMDLFKGSHQKMLLFIESLSDEQIFTPGYFPWTKTGTLMSFIRPNTGSHYRWARAGMRKGLRKKQQGG
jgi:hypothetical protein